MEELREVARDAFGPANPAEAAEFAHHLQSMRGNPSRRVRHSLRFAATNRRHLSPAKPGLALYNTALFCEPLLTTLPRCTGKAAGRRTHVSDTEPSDGFYRQKLRVDSRDEKAFQPTVPIDARRRLDDEINDDIAAGREDLLRRRGAVTAV